MLREVRVPDIGEFEEVEIVEVLVASGDRVEADESLVTLESDKASMDIPAPVAGRIVELSVAVGDMVGEGALIATFEVEAETEAAPAAEAAAESQEGASEAAGGVADTPAATPDSQPPPAGPRPESSVRDRRPSPPQPSVIAAAGSSHASPSVRRFARQLGVDLSQVHGSGRKGRILRDDVESFVRTTLAAPAAASALPQVREIDFSKFGDIEEVALSRIEKLSKANLYTSWVNVPHVTQFDEADITELQAFRKSKAAEAEERGVKLTFLPFLMRAVVLALTEHPRLGASLHPSGESLIYKKYFHIGIAVDTEDGLVVPVVRDVDGKDLYELAAELAELSARARAGKMRIDDVQGACFTISSLGGIGGTAFTPIVNAPEVAILGVSRSAKKPVYRDGELVPRDILPLSLSYDHRVVDGAEAVRFTTLLASLLADVERLV